MKLGIIFIITIALGEITTARKKRKKEHNVKLIESDENLQMNLRYSSKLPLNLTGQLRQHFAIEAALVDPESNMVCSPVSALLLLGKIALGASEPSIRQLLRALGLVNSNQIKNAMKEIINDLQYLSGVTLDIASRMYVPQGSFIDRTFAKDTREVFGSVTEQLNFEKPKEVATVINDWISKETHGMVTNIIISRPISKLNSLIVINAIYFTGIWRHPFSAIHTATFFSPYGEVKIPMMTTAQTYHYVNSSVLDAQVLEIPYQSQDMSFVIVLPNSATGLPVLLHQLKINPQNLNAAMAAMKESPVLATIPKFKITTRLDLKNLCEIINVSTIFNTERNGLSKIVSSKDMTVSMIIQKIVMEINEHGFTGPSISAGEILTSAETVRFQANHPFLFLVVENTQQLFAGIFVGSA